MRQSLRSAGFTLIELMISVAIVGILAAGAIPTMVKYIHKAKTGEASEFLHKLYTGGRIYFLEERTVPGQILPLPRQFPDTEPLTPAVSCCALGGAKCEPSVTYWATPTWSALAFSVDDPHYYQYGFESSGTGLTATFTADAVGDLDCDGSFSTFSMTAVVQSEGDVGGSAAVSRIRELE